MSRETTQGQFAKAVTFSLGYLILQGAGLVVMMMVLSPFLSSTNQTPPTLFVSEGQPLLRLPWQLTQSWEFETLDGHSVKMGTDQPVSMGAHLGSSESLKAEPFAQRLADWRMIGFYLGADFSIPWYFVREKIGERNTAYFVAYSNVTRAPLYYVGAHGESAVLPAENDRFQLVDGSGGVFTDEGYLFSGHSAMTVLDTCSMAGTVLKESLILLTRRGVERVELKNRRVTTLLEATDLVSAAHAYEYQFMAGTLVQKTPSSKTPLLVRTADSLLQIEAHRILGKYLIPEAYRDRMLVAFPVDQNTILYAVRNGAELSYGLPDEVVKCDAVGQQLEIQVVKQAAIDVRWNAVRDSLLLSVICPAPIQLVATLGLTGATPLYHRDKFWSEAWPSLLVLLSCGAISVLAAGYLAPRYRGVNLSWGWAVFVFVCGVPGLVGYLMQFRSPRRAVLEPAARMGTEIFG